LGPNRLAGGSNEILKHSCDQEIYERRKQMKENKPNTEELEATLEEFSIMELDERLEFVAWCDDCSCRPN